MLRFFRRRRPKPEIETKMETPTQPAPRGTGQPRSSSQTPPTERPSDVDIRRCFQNQPSFQSYSSWFAHWEGWISAGHCVTEAGGHVPGFALGETISWPDGLDAALIGGRVPRQAPPSPRIGQAVLLQGFPAGSRHMETRRATVYHERMPGQWIVHIHEPDEPVVTGMSGGPVICQDTGEPIGIIITRNSPADLDRDRDPDESADFIALSAFWAAIRKAPPPMV